MVREVLEPFLEARSKGRLAYLVGAGVSRDPPAHCPLAGEMIKALAECLWCHSEIATRKWAKATICSRAAKVRFETIMQMIAETTGSLGILGVLRGHAPNYLHRAIARALADRCPVLTTNFDQLIERASKGAGTLNVLKTSEDFRRWRRRTLRGVLAKLHGSLDKAESLCATMRQVGSLGLAFMWDPPRGDYLDRARATYPMAVMGYSGSDDADIVPRLRITESIQPLLWVFHKDSPPRVATENEIDRESAKPGLKELLKETKAVVLIGRTGDVIALLEGRRRPPVPTRLPRSARLEPGMLRRRLGRSSAPFLIDYLIARIFYESAYWSASRRLFAAVRRATEGKHPGLVARCLANEATVAADVGNWSSAGRLLDRALPGLQRWADHRAFLHASINRALVFRHKGHLAKACNLLQSLIDGLAGKRLFRLEWARASANMADMLFEQNQLDKATRFLKAARNGFKEAGDHAGLATVLGIFGKILFARGEHRDALVILQMALWHASVASDAASKARLLNNQGTIQRSLGLIDEAEDSFALAAETGQRLGDPEPVAVASMGMVTVDLARGDINRAAARARRCLLEAEQLGLDGLAAQTRGNLALAILGSGRYQAALPLFEQVLPLFEAKGPPEQAAFTLQNIGECLVGLGQRKEGVALLKEAATRYARLKRHGNAKAALAAAKRGGMRTSRR